MPAGLTNAEWEKIEELSKAELYKTCKQAKEKLAAYVEENDIQRASVQQLSAQVVRLREALGNFVNVEATRKLGKCKGCGQVVQGEQINYCYICSVGIAREALEGGPPCPK